MTRLVVRPDRYRSFGDRGGIPFCLVTDPAWTDRFIVEAGDAQVQGWHDGEDLAAVLAQLPEPAHVFVVAPGRLVTSPLPEQIGRRKVICMPCTSTPMPEEALAYYLDVVERTDPEQQQAFADAFFEKLEGTESLLLVDDKAGTTATFEHLAGEYAWNQQAGMIDWGEQQIAPAGELSVLPADVMGFDEDLRFALDGEIALRGWPIIHGGSAPYTAEEQEALYTDMVTAVGHPVIATVRSGEIVDLRSAHPAAAAAEAAWTRLFEEDARYRIVWEVGFGINCGLEVLPGNRSMNEVHGGRDGVLHIGVGLTPFTRFAPIVILPEATVRTAEGEFVLGRRGEGDATSRLNRRRVAACGCR